MPSGSRYKWQVVGMLWCICLLNYADRQAWVYGLGAPFAGLIVDRVRRTKALLGGLQAWTIICAVTGVATNY